jgi:putative ABC transport system permease protein
MDKYLSLSVAQPRFNSELLSLLAALALVLTAIGLYGVMAQMILQRKRELSIRLALGAQRRDVLRLVVIKGLVLTGAGICVGSVGAIWASRLLSSSLFGITATDPLIFSAVTTLLLLVGLFGSYIPARSIVTLDVAQTLRQD